MNLSSVPTPLLLQQQSNLHIIKKTKLDHKIPSELSLKLSVLEQCDPVIISSVFTLLFITEFFLLQQHYSEREELVLRVVDYS